MVEISSPKSRMQGRVFLVTTALLWGLAGVCSKSIVWSAFSKVAVRSFLSLIVLFSFKRSFRLKINIRDLFGASAAAVVGILYIAAMEDTTAGTAIVLQYVAPILVFLYAVLFQHRKAKISEILIVLAVVAGIVLSFADNLEPQHLKGNFLALLSGFVFAAQIILMNRPDTHSEDSMILGCLISFFFSFPFLFFDKGLVLDAKNLFWALIMGVFQYGFACLFFAKGVQKVDQIECSLLLTIEPIFNPIPVWIVCHEPMGTLAIIGAVVVILSVTLFTLLPKIEAFAASRKKA